MAWTFYLYVEIAKVSSVLIPLPLRLKVMRTRGASVGLTKKVSLTESERDHNLLHIRDRDNIIIMLTLG